MNDQGGLFNFAYSEGEPTIDLVDRLLDFACECKASDLHFEPQQDCVLLRVRTDGLLHTVGTLPLDLLPELVNRLKIMASLRTDEHRLPQDGRFTHMFRGQTVNIRLSVAVTYYGENAVMRLLFSHGRDHTLEALGLSAECQKKIMQALGVSHGLILITGPTGSGKTTTLYALLKLLSRPEVCVVTIEDPVEYSIAGVRQMQIEPKAGLGFSEGLRSMLRQDPDVIMVGEIRDSETAVIAVNAALTGHLVLSTLHTTNAASALPRLKDMGVKSYLLASTARLIVGQRLARRPQGGRIGVFEVMEISETVRAAVLSGAGSGKLEALALAEGMAPMLKDGLQKSEAGLTTYEEVLRILGE